MIFHKSIMQFSTDNVNITNDADNISTDADDISQEHNADFN